MTTTMTHKPTGLRRVWGALVDPHGLSLLGRTLLGLAAFASIVLVSTMVTERYAYTFTVIATAALWASCLNLTVGYTGQLNLSLGAFIALGAYIGALGAGSWGWSTGVILIVSVIAAAAISWLLSLVVFRARGLHFALLTAGLSLVTYGVLISWTDVTGGAAGLSTGGPITSGALPSAFELGPLVIDDTKGYLLLTVAFLILILWLTTLLLRRREGAGWVAVREDEWLSASVGVRVSNRKRVAFVLTSTLAAAAGVIYAYWIGFITPSQFSFAHASFDPLAMVVIGGAGTVAGPLLGALVVAGLPELFRELQNIAILLYGLALLAVMMLSPGGVMGIARDLIARMRRARVGTKEESE